MKNIMKQTNKQRRQIRVCRRYHLVPTLDQKIVFLGFLHRKIFFSAMGDNNGKYQKWR